MPHPKKTSPVSVAAIAPQPSVPLVWLHPLVLGLAALLLLAWLSREAGDSDSWWHLKSGQFILQQHRLPVPDRFAYTTYLGKPAYPGEEVTRHFNLTMEWLAEVAMYIAYAAGGLTALVLMRAVCLSLFCALAGLMAYRRTLSFYRAMGAAFATSIVLHSFTGDRPQYFTLLFAALAVNLLDSRRWLWSLPPLFLIWANCHAGFFLGWVVVGIYCAESLFLRWRGKPVEGERTMWLAGLSAILVSGLNPNGFGVLQTLGNYRQSQMISQIWEWYRPAPWELSPFTVLLYGGLAVLLWQRRKTRPADWLLLAAFGPAGLLAIRNVPLTGFVGAFLIAAYLPGAKGKSEVRQRPAAEWALTAMLLAATAVLVAQGRAFQFRASTRTPVGAADFLERHRIQGRLFNTWSQGGYLIWRLWPQLPVFIDGRVLNESVAADAQRILLAADSTGGKSYDQLLNDYGIDIIAMDCFEPVRGAAYYLPAALADPQQTDWKLVYRDAHDLIYMRRPPPDVPPVNTLDGLDGMEDQCSFLMGDGAPACAKGMVDVFSRIGDEARARKWELIRQGAHVE
jgi:hypothetical protein